MTRAINDAQFNKTRENSRMINNQTKDYYETKLVNKMNVSSCEQKNLQN